MKGRMVRRACSAAVLVITLAGCGSLGPATSSKQQDRHSVVPDLLGDTMDTVYDQLEAVGLVASATNAFGGSDWTADAVVVGMTPAPGTTVVRGSTVTISEATRGEIAFFSKPMPDLRGTMWIDTASGATEAVYPYLSFTWRDPRGKEKPGSIVAQKPAPGARIKLGTPIKLTVANLDPIEPGAGSTRSGAWQPDVNWPNLCRHRRWC
ncbi:PASTA domain-containing protein [Micromonospora sp. NPDC002296]|uniref:PASTA domain-containing protein n=1 Tax=Micromonospora sp. NPDC002296 TaxID=3154271 RepID=UPI0033280771